MTKIGLISDTHSWMDDKILKALDNCDEIWHAGDFGNEAVAEALEKTGKPVKGVYGNIDGYAIRSVFPEVLHFTCEAVPVMMKHIGGYPGRYAPGVKKEIAASGARLFISGHSHILKVQYDAALQCLHINPGAAGHQGWHTVRTLVQFVIDGDQIRDCAVVELGRRGQGVAPGHITTDE
ncbi:metallophosphoesterase family protein [Flavihumibacter petaseus]|uniref:Phosphoesterase n=1 Tax=Flavihumibacter petaseus NBRC 106054 TaxID=1220578 RepID=A0A0E9N1J7_9BACT|nr:metallophosphoesterase family protein [Flavihumibacter petaseus]GAO43501.1 hypothetical protein FPE01S_02_06060 [Flavihumibacter petaseus NBRC 106054]